MDTPKGKMGVGMGHFDHSLSMVTVPNGTPDYISQGAVYLSRKKIRFDERKTGFNVVGGYSFTYPNVQWISVFLIF